MSPILARTVEIPSYAVSKAMTVTTTTEVAAEAARSSVASEAAVASEAVAEALAEAASVEEWEAAVEPVHDSDPYR